MAPRFCPAAFCKSASFELPLAEAAADGTTATQEVEVRTLTPPSPSVVVHVFRTALDVDTSPAVIVSRLVASEVVVVASSNAPVSNGFVTC